MTNSHGTPIWYELMTTDPAAAGDYYTKVVGWTLGAFPGNTSLSGEQYQIFSAPDGAGVAGMMKLPAPMETTGPAWFGYIGVDSVDATVEGIVKAGGAVHMPPTDLPGVGRMAMVADPGGVVFYVMRGSSPEGSTAFKRMAMGHGEWNELYAADDQVALDFYASQFGWVKDGAMPMGEMGDYSFLSHDGGMIGAVMKAPAGDRPRWNYFFRVGQIDEAAERVTGNGGKIDWGPQEVPGGDWVVYATDPQGARFGLVGNK